MHENNERPEMAGRAVDTGFRCATKPPLDFPRYTIIFNELFNRDIRYHNLLIEIDHRVEHSSLMQAL